MADSICGIDCKKCVLSNTCCGCAETNGRPFGGECIVASHCREGEASLRAFKEKLIAAFRALGIKELEALESLNALKGSFINLEYALPGGQTVRFWDDNRIYLGNQLCQKGSDRCYGIAADEHYLMVCEYGENGSDSELVIFKRWN